MTDSKSTANDRSFSRIVTGLVLIPISLFPFVALMTYDWRAVAALQTPPIPSTNWIGPLGDGFAYCGYLFFGLAAWVIPVACFVGGCCRVLGRARLSLRKTLWFLLLLFAASSLVQVMQHGAPGVNALLARNNVPNAGGAIGYLAIDHFLSPLVSDFGASVIMLIVLAVSLVGTIGLKHIVATLVCVGRWAVARGEPAPEPANDGWSANVGGDAEESPELAAYRAAQQAKADAKRQREEEKRRIREEKLRAKEEKARLKAEEKAAQNAGPQPVPAAPRPAPVEAAPEEPADKGPYMLPPLSILKPIPASTADHGDVNEVSKRLTDTLMLFGVEARLDYTVQGPVVTKYAVELKPGTKYSAVTNIQDNLMGALHAKSLRIETPIPGEDRVGIEVPNRAAAGISFREIIESRAWKDNAYPVGGKPAKYQLPLLFGKDAAGRELVADLASMPHMLVAGATGQGKSVCLNSIICGLLMSRTPQELKLIMVDPKSVEFTPYASIPHLIVPVITENKKVVFSLHWAVAEMDKRLRLFARAGVKNILGYNTRSCLTQTDMFGQDDAIGEDMPRTVPYIVIIIDEAADLIGQCGKEVNPDIQRLTQKARAAGIHLILATQRPDAKIITGTIKANIPGRVAFKTATATDSRTILDSSGAENLIGRGDMLYRGKDNLLVRAQGAWISDDEIDGITDFIQQHADPDFDKKFARHLSTIKEAEVDLYGENGDGGGEDGNGESAGETRAQVKAAEDADLYKRALECIINTNRASTSHFQRRLGIGYNHAAKLCDRLEDAGVIGPQKGAGPREILLSQDQLLAVFNGGGETDAAPAADDSAPADGEDGDTDDLFNQEA